MKILMLILAVLTLDATRAANVWNPDPDSVWILEGLLSDGTLITSDISVYPYRDQWLLPLGELSDALGIAVQVSPALSMGRGFVLTENRKFEVDTKKCTVTVWDKTEKYPCDNVFVFQNDIYVTNRLLEKWFPYKISVNTYRAQMSITPLEKLPVQLRKEREHLAMRSKGLMPEYDPGFKKFTPPYEIADGPLIDEQLSLNRITENGVSYMFRHNTQVSGELLGLESYAYAGGSENYIDNWRLTFARRSMEGKVFGPFGVKQAQFVDVDLPRVSLVSSGISGKGFLFSSYPLDAPVNFETQDLQGPLQEGWEILLYRNEVLLERQVSDGSGRYLFRAVPLIYGKNVFRLSFFGPYGENRDEYKTFNVDPNLLRPGTFDYQVGMAFLKDSRQRLTMNYAQSLFKNLSANAGWLQDIGSNNTYATVGLTGLTDLFLLTSNCAFSLQGGKACEVAQQMGIGSATLGARYTRLFDFKSEIFNNKPGLDQVDQVSANLLFAIPIHTGLMTTWEYVKKNYLSTPSETSLVNRLALNTGRIFWNNELTYTFENSPPIFGKLNSFMYFSPFRLNLRAEYTSDGFKAYEGELQYQSSEKNILAGFGRYQVDNKKMTVGGRLSRLFKFLRAGFDVSYTDSNVYSAGILLSFSLYREPREGTIQVTNNPIAQASLASVQAYQDTNRNGVKDPEETPFADMGLVVNQREGNYKTDTKGISVVGPLRPHRPADFSVSLDSLEDPALKPTNDGIRLIPRLGKVAKVDIPFVALGGINGNIVKKNKGQSISVGRLSVELVDSAGSVIRTVRTDRDGYYAFEDLKPGSYSIRLSDQQLKGLALVALPKERKATVSEEGSFEDNQDFILNNKK